MGRLRGPTVLLHDRSFRSDDARRRGVTDQRCMGVLYMIKIKIVSKASMVLVAGFAILSLTAVQRSLRKPIRTALAVSFRRSTKVATSFTTPLFGSSGSFEPPRLALRRRQQPEHSFASRFPFGPSEIRRPSVSLGSDVIVTPRECRPIS